MALFDAQYHAGDVITSGVATPKSSDPRLQQLYDSNPYRNAEYTVSPWNQFLSWLGFRTQADSFKENMAIQAQEYDSQVAQMAYQQEYNSPESQLERMQAAGLNPNLNGGQSIDSGNSSGMPEDTSLPMVTEGDDVMIGRAVSSVLGAFSTAVGLVGSVQGVVRNRLQNSQMAIGNESQLVSLAESVAGSLLPESPEPAGMANPFDWKSQALRNAQKYAGRFSKKDSDRFLSFIESYWDSAYGQSKSYDEFVKRVNSRRGYYLESQTNYNEFDDVLKLITEPLAEMQASNIKSSLERTEAENQAAIAGAGTEQAYQEELNGELMGEAQNAENTVSKETNESLGTLREAINKIVQNLEKASKEDGVKGSLASLALALLGGLQMQFASGFHPSITRSQGSSESIGSDYASGSSRSSSSISF